MSSFPNKSLNIYPNINLTYPVIDKLYWYPVNSSEWEYNSCNSIDFNTNNCLINNVWYSYQSIHPYISVHPKYDIPDVVEHSFVGKITHLQS